MRPSVASPRKNCWQMQPEIQALADNQDKTYDEACALLQKQYDGYHFSKKSPDVYNPFSLINSLSKGDYAAKISPLL